MADPFFYGKLHVGFTYSEDPYLIGFSLIHYNMPELQPTPAKSLQLTTLPNIRILLIGLLPTVPVSVRQQLSVVIC